MKSDYIFYVDIYRLLKKRTRGVMIRTKLLRQIITKHYLQRKKVWGKKKENRGGDRKGLPRIYLFEVIKDMVHLGLIKKIDSSKYEILRSSCERRLKGFP